MATFKDPVRTVDTTNGLVAATNSASSGAVTAVDRIRIIGASNAAAANILTITNASLGQATILTIPDIGAATGVIAVDMSASVATAPAAITRVITTGFAALASAGSVTVQASTSATCQFQILDIKVLGITGLSGGGGDRLVTLTDGTIVFNNAGVTAAVAGGTQLVVWGGTGNPVSASAVSTTSTAGAAIVLKYSGGTTDFTAGSQKFAITLAQVTA